MQAASKESSRTSSAKLSFWAMVSFFFFLVLSLVLFFVREGNAAGAAAALPPGDFLGYLTVEQTEMYMDAIHSFLQDKSTAPKTIGTTRESNAIKAICLGACSPKSGGTPKHSVLFTGLHHAREPMSLMTLAYTMDNIVQNAGTAAVEALLEARQLHFIPIVNPDGYKDNIKQGNGRKYRRKNTLPGCSSVTQNGVDLNRNYDTCWEGDTKCEIDQFGKDCGNSPNPCAEDYRGPSKFSEPESKAVRDYVASVQPTPSAAFNYHSYGENLYTPYSCSKKTAVETNKEKRDVARIGQEVSGLSGYTLGNVQTSLGYNAAGDATDWMLDQHGIIAYTPETGPNDAEARRMGGQDQDDYGFWPTANRIPYHASKSTSANIRLAWLSGATYSLSVLAGKVTKSPSQNTIQSGLQLIVRNVGLRDSPAAVKILFLTLSNSKEAEVKLTDYVSRSKITADSEVTFTTTDKLVVETKPQVVLYAVIKDTTSCTSYVIESDPPSVGQMAHLPTSHFMCDESSSGTHSDAGTTGNAQKNKPSPSSNKTKESDDTLSILLYISGAMAGLSLLTICCVKCCAKNEGKYIGLKNDQEIEFKSMFSSEVNEFGEEPFRDRPTGVV